MPARIPGCLKGFAVQVLNYEAPALPAFLRLNAVVMISSPTGMHQGFLVQRVCPAALAAGGQHQVFEIGMSLS